MIQLTPHMRILVAVEPADFRNGIDGLARVCKEQLRYDLSRGLSLYFATAGRRPSKSLSMTARGSGCARSGLSQGRFGGWPQHGSSATQTLEAHQLSVLLSGGNPAAAKGRPPWRRVDGIPEK